MFEEYDDYGDDDVAVISPEDYGYSDFPVVSDAPESSDDSSFGSILQKLGSIGTTAARVGTAVGTIQRDVAQAKHNYTAARVNAKTGNSIGTFWMYATPVEKAMIILAVAAIVVTVAKD